MNNLLKAGCLAIYLAAAAGVPVGLPLDVASTLQQAAVILLVIHLLEALIGFRSVKRYQGPWVDSFALTLLFGFLHLVPLRRNAWLSSGPAGRAIRRRRE